MADWADTRVSLAGEGTLVALAVTASANGACLADVAGIRVTVRVPPNLTISPEQNILILRRGSVYWAIAVLTAAPAVPPPPPPPPVNDTPPVDRGDPAPAPKPVTTTGTLVCPPVATSSWRDGKWRTDIGSSTSADTFQGRYGGSGYGRNTGCAFYGSKPRSIAGATVTKATVRLRRLTSGDYARRSPTLRLVSQATRPSGAPSLNETTAGPALGVINQVSPWESTFQLPTSWGQAMVDGSRGGLAITVASDDPYIRLAGRDSWSAAWTLTLYWRRSS
ncbi:hypothetical protein OIE49_29740 [Streptomyces sp. NBC_01788]|uniref:hypothetical protein n=1 Tax=Streptomyces sp. NBC_01788 TaxID=2975940 RepID=UPI002DDC31C8|nr:hypothetical protein [Streptomyces sp. NBC_01788]WSB29736.1 hypothetical protein OIE49_29740 [Streptomyces sp. NBC_01788]